MNRSQILSLSAGQYLARYESYAIRDADGDLADGRYETRESAAGACQDASREDGGEYTVVEVEPEPRCGFGDDELDYAKRVLSEVGLTLKADDRGIRVVEVSR